MAQRTVVHLVDDLTGEVADETVVFGIDGAQYEIDLKKEHAANLRECLADYVVAARRLSVKAHVQAALPGARRGPGKRNDVGDIRAWANENGFTVSPRGRIPTKVFEAYDAVH